MLTREVLINNPSGLHARPASDFVKAAGQFRCRIQLRKCEEDARPVNAKSIVMILSQGLVQGTRAELIVDGEDEAAALDALTALIESGFGE